MAITKKDIKVYTVGADPEFFLCDRRTGSVAHLCGILGGTKAKPARIPGITANGFAMQEDNVMVEFNIPPALSPTQFVVNIKEAVSRLLAYISNINPNLTMDHSCSRLFPYNLLKSRKAQEFGCSPDMDSYKDGEVFPAMDRALLKEDIGEWRFAGGHVHLGYPVDVPPYVVANLADLYLGLPSIVDGDNQGERRKHYGQPGRFRPTSYGIEYRTLSNYWITNEEVTQRVASRAFYLTSTLARTHISKMQAFYQEVPWADVRRAISEENTELANDLYSYLSDVLHFPEPDSI